MTTYKATLLSFDGDSVSEGMFNDTAEVWDYINDLGSRWFFYPFAFVTTDKTVIEAPDDLRFLNGKRIKTVKRLFDEVYKATEEMELDCYEFVWFLEEYCTK